MRFGISGYLYRNAVLYYDKERYHSHDGLMFPMAPSVKIDPKYKKKDNCTVVVWKDQARCYPHPAFEGRIEDGDLIVTKDKNGFVKVTDKAGKQVPSMHAYWFAWCAFYPTGQTWSPPS